MELLIHKAAAEQVDIIAILLRYCRQEIIEFRLDLADLADTIGIIQEPTDSPQVL
jgi:hypothetical protein